MKKSEWSDKQLEDLLRQMPKIQDNRNPRDIYQNLSSYKKKKRTNWVLPGLATAAALFLFILLVPKLLNGTDYSFDRPLKENSIEQKNMAEDNASLKQAEGITGNQSKIMMASNKNALYLNDVGNAQVLTYWIPDPQINFLVPVSTLVTPQSGLDWLDLFTDTMGLLNEEAWGLSEYYPLNATLELDSTDNSLVVQVPQDHKYGDGSTSEVNFINVLIRNLAVNSDVKKIKFKTNESAGIEFGNRGLVLDEVVNPVVMHAYLFYTPEGMDKPLLVPSTNTFPDVNAAIDAMRVGQPDIGLNPPLDPSLQFENVVMKGKNLEITLKENSKMEDTQMMVYSLEALLLTAKEFGMETITVINAPIKQLGQFDLTKEIQVPISANFQPVQ